MRRWSSREMKKKTSEHDEPLSSSSRDAPAVLASESFSGSGGRALVSLSRGKKREREKQGEGRRGRKDPLFDDDVVTTMGNKVNDQHKRGFFLL